MNSTRRCLALLAALGGVLLAAAAAAPAALATLAPPPPEGDVAPPPVVHTVVVGGMPGWQIALIVAGAALVAAVIAVLADRAWARRPATTGSHDTRIPVGSGPK